MVDYTGTAEGPGGPGGPGMGGRGSLTFRGKAEDKVWFPVTKLGHLDKDVKIKYLEIYLFSLSIKESEIIDFFLGDEVLKIMPVQKQRQAGQQTRFKAFIATRDYSGHVIRVLAVPLLIQLPANGLGKAMPPT
uniref:S5 DRBM domain-containing protein n=1 Tax=Oryctolagus cuniculus TaxID=9986 RepID=A0A5F9CID9_RABIT